MSDEDFFESQGELISPGSLQIPRAIGTQRRIETIDHLDLIEIRFHTVNGKRFEILVVDVAAELPQKRVNDIRNVERLNIWFDESDEGPPIVYAMRRSFPLVPHLMDILDDTPYCLCLYNTVWTDEKLRWNPSSFLARILDWLERTAAGTLHGEDQALEPFFFASSMDLVYPANIFTVDQGEQRVTFAQGVETRKKKTFIVQRIPATQAQQQANSVEERICHVLPVSVNPIVHGVVRSAPRTLSDLARVLGEAEIIPPIDTFLRDVKTRPYFHEKQTLALLIRIPLKRTEDGPLERVQTVAFFVDLPLREIGKKLDVFTDATESLQTIVPIAGNEPQRELGGVPIVAMNAIRDITPERAAILSASGKGASDAPMILVGAGALGGALLSSVARAGFGNWSVYDDDAFLPHNAVRHVLTRHAVGYSKAHALAYELDNVVGSTKVRAVEMTIQEAVKDTAEVENIKNARLVVDASASVAASRVVAELPGEARRVSIFLTPSGKAGVLLMEDTARAIPLDSLEAQYYRWVINAVEGADHLKGADSYSYGQGCRDLTTPLPFDDINSFAALMSASIRSSYFGETASASVWISTENADIRRVVLDVSRPVMKQYDDFSVILDETVLAKIRVLRAASLPNETGGSILGYWDADRRRAYVVDVTAAPPDSISERTGFIRGTKGHKELIDLVEARTGGMVTLIGEWHSHPENVPARPSLDDIRVTVDQTLRQMLDDRPGLIMIAGDDDSLGIVLGESL